MARCSIWRNPRHNCWTILRSTLRSTAALVSSIPRGSHRADGLPHGTTWQDSKVQPPPEVKVDAMRKRIIDQADKARQPRPEAEWLDLERIAEVEITSEDP